MKLSLIQQVNITKPSLNETLQTLVSNPSPPGSENTKSILDAITQLIEMGADINETNKFRLTPILITKNMCILNHLITLGADLHYVGPGGRCILSYWIDELPKTGLVDEFNTLLDTLFEHGFQIKSVDEKIVGTAHLTPLAELLWLYQHPLPDNQREAIKEVMLRLIHSGSDLNARSVHWTKQYSEPLVAGLKEYFPNDQIVKQKYHERSATVCNYHRLIHALINYLRFYYYYEAHSSEHQEERLLLLLNQPVELTSYHALKIQCTELFCALIIPDKDRNFVPNLDHLKSERNFTLYHGIRELLFYFYDVKTEADVIRLLMPNVHTIVKVPHIDEEPYLQEKLVKRDINSDVPESFFQTYVNVDSRNKLDSNADSSKPKSPLLFSSTFNKAASSTREESQRNSTHRPS